MYSFNDIPTISPSLLWDTFKASARDFILNNVFSLKKSHAKEHIALLSSIKSLQHQYFSSKLLSDLHNLVQAKLKCNSLSTNDAASILLWKSVRYYGGGIKQVNYWRIISKLEKRRVIKCVE